MFLFQKTGLTTQIKKSRLALFHALKTARITPGRRWRERGLTNVSARHLSAASFDARIRWAQALCEEFEYHFGLSSDHPEPDQRMYLITLCDRRCCTPHTQMEVDTELFIKLLRRGLRGLNYLGMIEPAYFVDIQPGTYVSEKRTVCWHVHVIAWGTPRRKIKKRIEGLLAGNAYHPMANGLSAVDQKQISKGRVAAILGYILKYPHKAYRIGARRDAESGETHFQLNKDGIRSGERLTLQRLMKRAYLDQMTLAGGDGINILERTKQIVLRATCGNSVA